MDLRLQQHTVTGFNYEVMKNKLILFFGIISLFLSGNLLQAQQLRASYPVQVNAVLLPPYTLYLSDFCNSPREKIILMLQNRDIMEGDINVRLHVSIHAGNIQMETKDFNVLPVFTLPPGVPTKIDQSDLCPYFQTNNLNITGAFDGKFPEGMIEICFSVFEANSGQLISQTSCARAWVTLNRPPLLNLPQNKANYPFREPQQIVFQWTPRHQALSNVEYEFTLKEIYDSSTGIENAFAYSPTLYSTTVYNTSLPYNTAIDPPFLEDRTYAWQVRAVVRDGFEELNIFENNGFSEIRSFSLMPACKPPIAPSARQEGSYERIEWTPSDPDRQQVIAYRGKETQGAWHVQKANLNYANILDAAPGKEIEYKVGTVCVDGTVVYSEVQTFILEDWRENLLAQCGSGNQSNITNRMPMPELNVGDVFISAGVPVTITQISGSNGIFSGYGWMEISILGELKLACKFTNVQVNSDGQHFAGTVESVYDASESQIANLDFIDQGGTTVGDTNTGDIWTDLQTDLTVPPGGGINYDPNTGTLVITDAEGNPVGNIELPPEIADRINNGESFTYTVQDGNGDIYTITSDGEGNASVEQTGSTGNGGSDSGQFNPKIVNSQDAVVTFSKGSGKYAFDEWINGYEQALLIRDKYENLNGYYVPCKLIPPGRTDKVAFEVKQTGKEKINADSIIFRSGTGTEYIAKNGEISITGGKENDAQDIYALYPDGKGGFKTLGKLKVLSYKELNLNVKIVPVNGNTIDEKSVENYLNNEVYGKLGISWTVSKDENFSYPNENLQSEGSSFFSLYTNEMKALNAAYKSQRGVDKQTVYLFVMNTGNVKGYDLAGDMPRGGQFGYIFKSSGNINRTIAHELGHGKLKLRHTFDNDYGKLVTTDNLMDYSSGTHLAKWQWDVIFDPALLVSPFESDEEGMSQENPMEALLEKATQLKNEFGNVYAIVHGFSTDPGHVKNKYAYEQNIIPKDLGGIIPIYIQGFYSEKAKIYTSVLFFEYSDENNMSMGTVSTNYDLRGNLKSALQISSDIPYLAVLVPEEKARDCTPFIGDLNQEALSAIMNNEFTGYYKKMLIAVENCTQEGTLLIFANGYRKVEPFEKFLDPINTPTEFPNTNNEVFTNDINNYWVGMDTKFIERLKPRKTVYVDGHFSLTTSNHLTLLNFISSYTSFIIAQTDPTKSVVLDTKPNKAGFNERRKGGAIAGARILDKIKKGEYAMRIDNKGNILDKVDIVCHSMGFAYALGIIDVLKQAKIPLGRFYIIAPENACSGEVNVNEWEQVWQYGTDEANTPLLLQDGVAPQCPVINIGDRRAYIPSGEKQGFIESHLIENYGWIFTREKGVEGYVTPRK